MPKRHTVTILMADDDPDDRLLATDAAEEAELHNELHFVQDGEELLDYLHRRGKYEKMAGQPLPGLILLDLNMPRKDGREALREIKSNPALRCIPIVVLSTSKSEEDIVRSYQMGANSFVTKPVTFDSLVSLMRAIGCYWFEIVELPSDSSLEASG